MCLLWAHHAQEEDWRFVLIDACNTFNKENQTSMLWDVPFKWPSGVQLNSNYYRHWATLVERDVYGSGHLLHNKEIVTQGYPLAMIAYRILILLIIYELRTAHPHFNKPWYADKSGV